MSNDSELESYRRACGILMDALSQYANPEFYHAIMILADRPSGEFADDFSQADDPSYTHYNREMPGKLAREAIKRIEQEYGDLTIISEIV